MESFAFADSTAITVSNLATARRTSRYPALECASRRHTDDDRITFFALNMMRFRVKESASRTPVPVAVAAGVWGVKVRTAQTEGMGGAAATPPVFRVHGAGGTAPSHTNAGGPAATPSPGLWQRDCWDTQLRDVSHYGEKWLYVTLNPVRKAFATSHNDWRESGWVIPQ